MDRGPLHRLVPHRYSTRSVPDSRSCVPAFRSPAPPSTAATTARTGPDMHRCINIPASDPDSGVGHQTAIVVARREQAAGRTGPDHRASRRCERGDTVLADRRVGGGAIGSRSGKRPLRQTGPIDQRGQQAAAGIAIGAETPRCDHHGCRTRNPPRRPATPLRDPLALLHRGCGRPQLQRRSNSSGSRSSDPPSTLPSSRTTTGPCPTSRSGHSPRST